MDLNDFPRGGGEGGSRVSCQRYADIGGDHRFPQLVGDNRFPRLPAPTSFRNALWI